MSNERLSEQRTLNHFSMAARRNTARLENPPAQTVVVEDGMGHTRSYPTITQALNSITDASDQNEYLVTIGPGTYMERVTLKSWVYVRGSGPAVTTIFTSAPAVIAAPHSSIASCHIYAITAPADVPALVAMLVQNAPNTSIGSCTISTNNMGMGVFSGEVVALSIDPDNSGSSCAINDCQLKANAYGSASAVALRVAQGSLVEISTSSLRATAAPGVSSRGGVSLQGAALTANFCAVEGSTYALYCDDSGATLTARDCKINGPVSPNVQVIK